jgi:hypothetical protein
MDGRRALSSLPYAGRTDGRTNRQTKTKKERKKERKEGRKEDGRTDVELFHPRPVLEGLTDG